MLVSGDQPKSGVCIQTPCGIDIDGDQDTYIVRVNESSIEEGTIESFEMIDAELQDGIITFTADHFSV